MNKCVNIHLTKDQKKKVLSDAKFVSTKPQQLIVAKLINAFINDFNPIDDREELSEIIQTRIPDNVLKWLGAKSEVSGLSQQEIIRQIILK